MLPVVTDVAADEDLAGFAALMAQGKAQADPKGGDPAPYGYTRDEGTGEMRPKKAPGRPRKSPSLDDLKERRAAAAADTPDSPTTGDRPPAAAKGRKGRRAGLGAVKSDRPAPPVPQYLRNEGGIAKAVNRSYRKIGKLVRVMDADVGNAIIACTQAVDEDDITVGDAWEQLAKTNPRVRAFLLKMLAGGAVSQLVWAHLPILAAIVLKDSVQRRIPLARLAMAFAADSDDEAPADAGETSAGVFQGLREEDVAQAMAFAAAMQDQMTARAAGGVPDRGEP
jgi:hypothetical protein